MSISVNSSSTSSISSITNQYDSKIQQLEAKIQNYESQLEQEKDETKQAAIEAKIKQLEAQIENYQTMQSKEQNTSGSKTSTVKNGGTTDPVDTIEISKEGLKMSSTAKVTEAKQEQLSLEEQTTLVEASTNINILI